MNDIVQVKNPRTKRYVKIDRTKGVVGSRKKSEGPYKGVPIIAPRTIATKEKLTS